MRWRLIISLLILSGLLDHTHSVFRRLLPQKPAAPHHQDPAHNSHLVRDLVATINDAVLASSRRLESADGEGRTATAANDRDGSWFARPALLQIQDLLAGVALDQADAVADRWLARAPWPTFVNITSSAPTVAAGAYELSLFGVPAGAALAPRRHPAGTLLVYRRVAGELRMRSLIHTREVSVEPLADAPLVRLAGKTVVFESMDGRFAAVLELAVFPPRRVEEGFGGSSGFDADAQATVGRVDLDVAAAERLFRPVTDATAEEAARQQGKPRVLSWRKASPR